MHDKHPLLSVAAKSPSFEADLTRSQVTHIQHFCYAKMLICLKICIEILEFQHFIIETSFRGIHPKIIVLMSQVMMFSDWVITSVHSQNPFNDGIARALKRKKTYSLPQSNFQFLLNTRNIMFVMQDLLKPLG